jgi:hypothetical protein
MKFRESEYIKVTQQEIQNLSLSSVMQGCKVELVGGVYCKLLKAFVLSTAGCLI